ncbi:MAG: 4'-phosphopantetheinyl transferase superfamily protein [Anaerolineae bacterium]
MNSIKTPEWKTVDQPPILLENTIDLWLVDLNPAGYEFPAAVGSVFSTDELERAARFRFDRHRRQYLVGRQQLRHILGAYAQTNPADIQFRYGEYGKPFLASSASHGLSEIQFNLSNSHEMALIGVSRLAKIGVDIEYRDRHIWDVDNLASSVFTDQEQAELAEYPADQRLIPFLSGWTRKEAYLKGVGKGLALPLKGFSVELKNSNASPDISIPEWGLESFWSTSEYLSAVAFPASQSRPDFRWFKFDESLISSN